MVHFPKGMPIKVNDIYSLLLLQFVYKQQHSKLPEIFSDCFVTRDKIHSINIRGKRNLHIKQIKGNIGHKSIKVTGALTYNDMPVFNKESRTLKEFSRSAKSYLLSNSSG